MKIFGNNVIIETERLKIRLFNKEDREDVFCYLSENQETKNKIKYSLEDYNKNEDEIFYIVENKEDGKIIGKIAFVNFNKCIKCSKLECNFSIEFENEKMISEALKEVIRFGFVEMELNRIEIECDEKNSLQIERIEKIGFKYEGTLRQKKYIKGEYINLNIYSILKDEYNIQA